MQLIFQELPNVSAFITAPKIDRKGLRFAAPNDIIII